MLDLSRYTHPALHFSGGKDSLACLYLLREQLDHITCYWVNTGDGCPETLAVVDTVRQWVPRFVEVRSDVAAWREQYGAPTDLLPATAHAIGAMYGMGTCRLSSRFDCCYFNIMLPMHQRMLADGCDAVIRGTKLADTGTVPCEGRTEFYDVILPVRDWSHDEVFAYLKSVGAPENAIYEHFKSISAPECMGCTAWWDDNKAAYFAAKHPAALAPYRAKLRVIRDSVQEHMRHLDAELGE